MNESQMTTTAAIAILLFFLYLSTPYIKLPVYPFVNKFIRVLITLTVLAGSCILMAHAIHTLYYGHTGVLLK